MLISCMVSESMYASDLKKVGSFSELEVQDFEWVLGNENVLSVCPTPLISPNEQLNRSASLTKMLEGSTVVAALHDGSGQADSVRRVREYKKGLAGALLGGCLAAWVYDSYDLKVGAAFLFLTSAVAVAAHSEEIISSDDLCLVGGFISGLNVPLVVSKFVKRR